jgi:hypothetical protein
MTSVSLERLQAEFAGALLDDVGAPELVGEPGAARLALYRGNVQTGWRAALAQAYPVVRALVGEEFFSALARAYARAHPSASGDLNAFGAGFSDFIDGFLPAQSLSYLGDVAALEWLAHRAYRAADAGALARERIAAISPHELLASRFVLHPACAWMQSRYPIASIWRAHQADAAEALPDSLEQPQSALVIRPHWHVEVTQSSAAEIAALAQLRAGGDMDAAIGAALLEDRQFDFGKALLRWLDLGVLIDMR